MASLVGCFRVVSCIQEDFSCHKIPHHHNGGGTYLCDEVVDVEELNACPHAEVVYEKAYHAEHNKNDEFPFATHALLMCEHIAHGGYIVKDH